MSQSPLVETPTPLLKPALKAVMGSLDVQLEAELARFRRQRRAERSQSSSQGGIRYQPQQTVESISIDTNSSTSQTEPASTLASNLAETANSQQVSQEQTPQTLHLESSRSPFSLLPPSPLGEAEIASAQSAAASELAPESDEPGGSLVRGARRPEPDDYLESSEKLLKSLDEEEAKKLRLRARRRAARSHDSLLSPLGIGSMLLFLAAIGTLGYVMINQSGSGNRTLDTALNRRPPNVNETASNGQPETVNPANLTPVPLSPDLASKEFKQLDLETLGSLSDNSTQTPSLLSQPSLSRSPAASNKPSPSPSASQTTAPGLSNLSTALLPSSGQEQPTSQPASPQPSRAPASEANLPSSSGQEQPTSQPASPQPSKTPASGETLPPVPAVAPTPITPGLSSQSFPDFYYVLMEYKGDNSLEQARELIPDAYVREFPLGVRIQVAALEEEAEAKAMVEQLKQEGVAAQVYKP